MLSQRRSRLARRRRRSRMVFTKSNSSSSETTHDTSMMMDTSTTTDNDESVVPIWKAGTLLQISMTKHPKIKKLCRQQHTRSNTHRPISLVWLFICS
jgi:hypothetical protein